MSDDVLVQAVLRNINHHVSFLSPHQVEYFFEWITAHTGQDVVEHGRLNGRLTTWLKGLEAPHQLMEESFLITCEIVWCRIKVHEKTI